MLGIVARRRQGEPFCSLVVTKLFFQVFIEPFGKSCNIFRGIERRPSQFFWLRLGERYRELVIFEHTRDLLPRPCCNKFSAL